ncbi:MAG TPA: ATP-binding protein [Methylomirabilota bacterium]|jgi:two-component system sensor histidine kinase PilS (NtrC family)|nr:ATP-binding protein [Methylomirabilota bacterium]
MAQRSETQNAVRWLIIMRAGVTTLLFVSVAGVYLWGYLAFPFGPFAAVVGASCALSVVSWILARWIGGSTRFAEIQIYLDILLETALIYVTGGTFSLFTFIYLFSILATSIVVTPRRSFVTAAVSVLCHGLLLDLQFYRVIPPVGQFAARQDVVAEGSFTILLISANVCASFTVAYLATYLAEQLRQVRWQARRTEASLAELQVQHEDIVQSVSSGLVTFDRDGRTLTANRTVETLSGRAQRELQRHPFDRIFQQAPAFSQLWDDLRTWMRQPCRFPANLVRADGSVIPIGVSASLLRHGSGEPMGVICSFQDLSDIKRMEAQVRHADRLAAIGRLAAGLAHEIRNPIASIRGSVEVLRQNLKPQGADRRLMDIVLRESDRLDGTITEFLEFSRPRRREPVLTDVTAIMDEILLLLGQQAGHALRTVKEYPDGTVKAYVDPAQVRQALWNLCRNAVDAMPQGGTLRVAARLNRAAWNGRGVVEIVVEDTGPGVAPEHLPHIFEPFYTTKPDGTGLGLAIVHRIIEEHEGEIRVETREGGGARFVVAVPGVEL